jgi:molybdenum cofactor cytidylyltransferase
MPRLLTESVLVGAIVLAAGASTRMGTNKMLLEFEGEPLVRRAVRRVQAAGAACIVVVLGHEPERVRTALAGMPCDFATNPDYIGPTSGSLHAGLRKLPDECEAVVVMLGDMVHVTSAMVRAVVSAAGQGDPALVVSRYGGVTAPPLLFRRSLFTELLMWTGEGCGKAVVRAHAHEAVYMDWPESALADVDTPQDYAALGDGSR